MTETLLPSWRPGATRDALVAFLDASEAVPVADRVAYFDNDGTLWNEHPHYVQLLFFLDELTRRAAGDPTIAERPEFAALIGGDQTQIAELGMVRIALALAGLFEGWTPAQFSAAVASFVDVGVHPVLNRPLRTVVFQPMLELIDELRRRDFTVGIVSGGGTEFVRAVSQDLYGVAPELVVGTLVEYEYRHDDAGPSLHRTANVLGEANEGPAKVTNIQTQLGRAPILAAGNSAGDQQMLEWALVGDGPRLAILVDHDDADREAAYASEAGTFEATEAITATAARLGWTTVSVAHDWEVVFPGGISGSQLLPSP